MTNASWGTFMIRFRSEILSGLKANLRKAKRLLFLFSQKSGTKHLIRHIFSQKFFFQNSRLKIGSVKHRYFRKFNTSFLEFFNFFNYKLGLVIFRKSLKKTNFSPISFLVTNIFSFRNLFFSMILLTAKMVWVER